ncbi:MAG: bifunctional phosphoribosylaminoimidazolecarboxamide formyltransferase/IMP cyclohydrolase [Clostridiales bacterium]|jgi:phosphoribosylaminoimidazolecarboxamide formyltransferase/IMP cyclohydrolase|nr:bifunctional phosphoribosylaminoimidazolecarboxamide formyltransferase/IMP cyclohydrolase [Clostridiales bacterium]
MNNNKKRALISVSDKTGAVELARGLCELGYEIVSTGGTAKALTAANVPNIGISEITNFPECLDGRVKTLHPAVHAGLLALRGDPAHMKQLADLELNTIDVAAVNLYPFKETISKPGATMDEAVENIDIGGPTMLRSAAKNYKGVIVLTDPADYGEAVERLKTDTADERFRLKLMYKAFAHTAVYDSLISNYLGKQLGLVMPDTVTFAYEKAQGMRYGENPHQKAAFYRESFPVPGSVSAAVQLHGKELSYNNINDTNGALELLREFSEPCAVAVKHSNPCGVAAAKDIFTAYCNAYACDPVSIFGGIVALNRRADERTAAEINKIFVEIVVAPGYEPAALEILKRKQNIRILELPSISAPLPAETLDMKKVVGGLLVQEADRELYIGADLKTVTKALPTAADMEQLKFAWKVVKHTKSNAIVVAKDFCAVGIGGGQTNRIWAAQEALQRAGERARGAYLASDAYFPFPDCAAAAAESGIRAIIQPGGSIRDADSVAECDKAGIAMVFTGQRHFKH